MLYLLARSVWVRCLVLTAASIVFLTMAVEAAAAPVPEARLRHLVRQDCGSCHGLTFRGGLGSPLTPAALVDKPDESLVATILDGRPGTAMPPWWPFLSPDEALAVVRWLREGAPE